jgi:hypothetical protein
MEETASVSHIGRLGVCAAFRGVLGQVVKGQFGGSVGVFAGCRREEVVDEGWVRCALVELEGGV